MRRYDYAKYVVFETFPWPGGPGGATTKAGRAYYQALQGRAELPIERLPMLVRFRDINDQNSVTEINPSDLAASFGQGVKLGTVTIEMTTDPVTEGIDEHLNWLNALAGGYLGGVKTKGQTPLGLHAGDFRKGKL